MPPTRSEQIPCHCRSPERYSEPAQPIESVRFVAASLRLTGRQDTPQIATIIAFNLSLLNRIGGGNRAHLFDNELTTLWRVTAIADTHGSGLL